MKTTFLISVGAILGALSRYSLGLVYNKFSSLLPFSTFTANMLGCLIIGFSSALLLSGSISKAEDFKLFFIVGFLGSFTTFSSYALEVFKLSSEGNIGLSIMYFLGSAFIGLALVALGFFLGEIFFKQLIKF